MESEFIALDKSGEEAEWLRNFLEDIPYWPKPVAPDNDTNYHMDFIARLANMKARNYSTGEVDKLKAKFIAGRIIPAIAATTAMATGLVCLELYKVLAGGAFAAYGNWSIMFSQAEFTNQKLISQPSSSI
ncbi:hypothetical protein T459_01855 [Capsicum annuum]|uniref:Ubiquitin-activating enzyme SCCH domain-containing protein n=1 Tax=Capsicum annuum TaxID=4072 RepID=A0A2G3AIH6_CAPAN|nr:hypothetical protein T459_01855 [Capsicum annuum]